MKSWTHQRWCIYNENEEYTQWHLPSVEKLVAEGAGAGATGQRPLWDVPPGPAGLPNIIENGPPPLADAQSEIKKWIINVGYIYELWTIY